MCSLKWKPSYQRKMGNMHAPANMCTRKHTHVHPHTHHVSCQLCILSLLSVLALLISVIALCVCVCVNKWAYLHIEIPKIMGSYCFCIVNYCVIVVSH